MSSKTIPKYEEKKRKLPPRNNVSKKLLVVVQPYNALACDENN